MTALCKLITCNSLTHIEWVVQLLLPPKHAKSREILREFDLTAVQGHPRSSILVSIESPYEFLLVIISNFSRIWYRFRDIDA